MNIRTSSTFKPGNIAGVQNAITQRVVGAVTKGTEAVLNTALSIVPVDTGDLQSSGHMEVTIQGQTVTGRVIFDSDHSAYVEFGTGIRGAASPGAGEGISYNPQWPGMPAQPYLRPALDRNREVIRGYYAQEGFKV